MDIPTSATSSSGHHRPQHARRVVGGAPPAARVWRLPTGTSRLCPVAPTYALAPAAPRRGRYFAACPPSLRSADDVDAARADAGRRASSSDDEALLAGQYSSTTHNSSAATAAARPHCSALGQCIQSS